MIEEGSTVTLTAIKSTDLDGDKLTFSWSQVAGPKVQLNNKHSPYASFKSPSIVNDAVLIFKLTVDDGEPNGKASDYVKITVRNADDDSLSNNTIHAKTTNNTSEGTEKSAQEGTREESDHGLGQVQNPLS